MVDRTVCMKAYIPCVLCIPSGHVWMDLGMDYGVYGVDHTVCMKAYIPYVLRIPSGHAWMDLGTDYGVYFFSFSRSGITEDGITDDFL